MLLILLGGYGLLEALTWQAGLGRYASSPQRLQISRGNTAIAAGGQAGILLRQSERRRSAELLVRCEKQQRMVKLRPGRISEEICDVRVKLIDILPDEQVEVEIRWGGDAFPEDAAPANGSR
ncbi:MAG: hypothetical protein AAF725_04710 [Acidobacteriota bacterium]